MLKVAKGETGTAHGEKVEITKVSKTPQNVMNGNKKVGDLTAITPVYRVYYKHDDGRKGHSDVAIDPSKVEVVVG